GPVAKSAGVTFEESAAVIGLLGNAGIQGSMAGTALRGAISRLLNPTGEAARTLERLGVNAVASSGALRPLPELIGQLEGSGASTADMMTIFGDRAGPAMAALVDQGSDAIQQLTDQVGATGTAQAIAETQMEGFNGSLKALSSAFEGLMIAIAESGLLEFATDLVLGLTGIVQSLAETNPGLLKLATVIGGVLAVGGPMLSMVGRMIRPFVRLPGQIARTASSLVKLGKSTGRAARSFGRLAAQAGRAAGRVVAAGARMAASA